MGRAMRLLDFKTFHPMVDTVYAYGNQGISDSESGVFAQKNLETAVWVIYSVSIL